MSNLVVLFNPGPTSIHDFTVVRHQAKAITLLDNQCVEVDKEIAEFMIKEFPHLKIIGGSVTTEEKIKGRPVQEAEEEAWLQNEARKQLAAIEEPRVTGIAPSSPHYCSMCATSGIKFEAKSKAGLNLHIFHRHERK